MRVLVTGASGMLGRAVATYLADRGDDVTVLQRGESHLPVREVRSDLRDIGALQRACAGQDGVIHLAAKVSVTGTWEAFQRTNVVGTANLLQTARAAGVGRFVQVSSPSVAYAGRPLVGAPAGPATPELARGHYARSKAMAELSALAANTEDFAVVAVRPHLVWGPGDTQLVGRIVERARQGRLVLINHGSALIDSTYVDNAATALTAALDVATMVGGRSFVVTNGEPRTVAELLSRICRASGVPEPTRSVTRPIARAAGLAVEKSWPAMRSTAEPPMTRFLAEQLSTAHWFDQTQVRQALRWQPQVSLAEGFVRLTRWEEAGRPTQGGG